LVLHDFNMIGFLIVASQYTHPRYFLSATVYFHPL
jgi:hypothetical protein